MEVGQLRYFVSAVDSGSLSLAAKRMFVTVQAVSKSLSELENELDCKLLVRDRQGVHTTQMGAAFYTDAVKTLHEFDELGKLPAHLNTGNHRSDVSVPRIAVYARNINDPVRFCNLLEEIVDANLGMRSSFFVDEGPARLSRLERGIVDAGFCLGAIDQPGVECMPFASLMPLAVLASNHPLAQEDAVTLAQLSDYPVYCHKDPDGTYGSLVRFYANRGLTSPPIYIGSNDDASQKARDSDGFSLAANVPRQYIGHAEGTVIRPIAEQGCTPFPVCLVGIAEHQSASYQLLKQALVDFGVFTLDKSRHWDQG